MTFRRLRQPLLLWLALLIAVFGAITPTRSHPHVGQQGEVLAMAVCTSTGMCWLVAEPPPPDASSLCSAQTVQTDNKDAPAAGRIWDQCPLCLIFGFFGAAAAHVWVADFATQGAPVLALFAQVVFHFDLFLPLPPPRGPPVL
ncbi:MAG: hypothetical protein KA740_14390 [Rhodoferax sp.]|nr:hypothetical protein [Rhodoferax sp.]